MLLYISLKPLLNFMAISFRFCDEETKSSETKSSVVLNLQLKLKLNFQAFYRTIREFHSSINLLKLKFNLVRIIQRYQCIYYYYFKTPCRYLNYTPDTYQILYIENHILLSYSLSKHPYITGRKYSFREINLSRVADTGLNITFI